jgi:hypothetical protein
MPEFPEPSIEKTSSISPVLAEEDIVPCTEVDKLERIPRRHKLSIDLNRPTFEENPWEDRVEIRGNFIKEKYW